MDTKELWKAGNCLIGGFVGVFPLDKIPPVSSLKQGNSFIVNTQTHNLPGEHWIAVYEDQFTIRVFDPMSLYYRPFLVSYLHNGQRRVVYNRVLVQDPYTPTCGQHCLLWLSEQ